MTPSLDPQIEGWLRAYPTPDIDPFDVAGVRALTSTYMADRGGAAPRWPRDDVHVTSMVCGGVPVLVWASAHVTEPAPTVVALHGGAFIVGSALGAEHLAVPLASAHGVTTVSVDYRLAPENRAPAAFDDLICVMTHLSDLPNVDPSRLALHGASAGAALAGSGAIWARDEGIDVRLQSLSCPALDHLSWQTNDPSHSMAALSPTLGRREVQAMWQHYLGDRPPGPYDVPAVVEDLSGVAPAHITIAEYDVLRDEGLAYADRLSAVGVDVRVDVYPGTVHGFDGLLSQTNVGGSAVERQVSVLAEALR